MKKITLLISTLFGIPVYVLDDRLQAKKKIPKWEPKSRVGVYLGQSKEHASNVSYVLNTATGHISPQYHIIYDDDDSIVDATNDAAATQR